MVKRDIVEINEELCDGCGLCVPNCHEGALQIIDGKARLISDLFCDGLGNCLGHCPKDAITIVKKDVEPYDERKVMELIVPKGTNTLKAHLQHLKDHSETKFLNEAFEYMKEHNIENPLEGDTMKKELPCGCPGSAMKEIKPSDVSAGGGSALSQWPVQLNLLSPMAPFFDNAHLLVAADCVPFAMGDFHAKLLHGKALVIGCPKLDDIEEYQEKLTAIFEMNNVKSVTVAIMEVPCCHGMYSAVESAIESSGKKIPLIKEVIGVNGSIK